MLRAVINRKANNAEDTIINILTKHSLALTEAVKKENHALQQGALSMLKALNDAKIKKLEEFNAAFLELKKLPKENLLRNRPGIDKLRGALLTLDKVNEENEILLKTNIGISQKIVEIYKSGFQEDTLRKYGYDGNGALAATQNLEKLIPSISLNNKI